MKPNASILNKRSLILATLASLAVSSAAFAQDTDTAAGKRFSVVGGVTLLQPNNDTGRNNGLKVDGGPAPTASVSYNFTDNISAELWGALDSFDHRVKQDGVKIGNVDQQPIALSGQYHFGDVDNTFRPFVGLGYHQSNISNEDLGGGGDHVSLTTPKGAIGTVGVDMNINSTWFARADARYLRSRADVKQAGQTVQRDLKLDPWTVGVGIGARF
ncbi:outer membrane beta-barrel protein [Luteimonas sp. S4-F44]|uniref:OmpW/AlkL family protein n=1 Tax=Luteimonas sp. S4-F44 TaxID=2925842 RepID=UPI001F52C13B|nr:OmpW family outer membrane protein [Luteimonas sp. S4-F44]UNK42060.1 outer membrane beta-barrel protein [Luteimonas sp. S4-F44]